MSQALALSRIVQERARGALLGLAWGDALGCPIEGWTAEEITRHYGHYGTLPQAYPASVERLPARRRRRLRPLGLHSDDTQQALALLATATAGDGWSPRTWASWLVAGAQADAWRGTGANFATAVANLRQDVPPERAGSPSAGIGAAMRAGPLGAVFVVEPDTLARVVMQASVTTHADLRAAAVAYAVAEAVRRLVTGRTPDVVLAELGDRVARVEAAWLHDPGDWRLDTSGRHAVSTALRAFAAAPPADLGELGERICAHARPHVRAGHSRIHPNQGFAMLAGLHGLVAALLPCADPSERLADIVAQGYDTDTVGAICGSVLGACHGTTWFPLRRLVDAERLQRWADALAQGRPPPEDQATFLAHEAALTDRQRRWQQQLPAATENA